MLYSKKYNISYFQQNMYLMIVPSERYLEALIHANRTTLILNKV